MSDRDALKDRVCASIDARHDLLLDVSHRIHADPELGFAEHHAHDLLTGVLAEHISPNERVHGIFTRAGDRPNIVPREAETFWFIRAGDLDGLVELNARVSACLRAGADAAGC